MKKNVHFILKNIEQDINVYLLNKFYLYRDDSRLRL